MTTRAFIACARTTTASPVSNSTTVLSFLAETTDASSCGICRREPRSANLRVHAMRYGAYASGTTSVPFSASGMARLSLKSSGSGHRTNSFVQAFHVHQTGDPSLNTYHISVTTSFTSPAEHTQTLLGVLSLVPLFTLYVIVVHVPELSHEQVMRACRMGLIL